MFEEFGIYSSLIYYTIIVLSYTVAILGIIFGVLISTMVIGLTLEKDWNKIKSWWS
jgi:hypothetical protein